MKFIVQVGHKFYGPFETDVAAQTWCTLLEANYTIHPLIVVGSQAPKEGK